MAACALWCRSLDAYPKTLDEFLERTRGGGLISIVACVVIGALLLADIRAFVLEPPRRHVTMDVDTTPPGGRMRVQLNISLPALACDAVELEALDHFGARQAAASWALYVAPLAASGPEARAARRAVGGVPCGRCFAITGEQDAAEAASSRAGSACCNTCADVRAAHHAHGLFGAWKRAPQCRGLTSHAVAADGTARQLSSGGGEPPSGGASSAGCALFGHVELPRAAGVLRLSGGAGANLTHVVHALTFGRAPASAGGAGAASPTGAPQASGAGALAGAQRVVDAGAADGACGRAYEYTATVVPEAVRAPDGALLHRDQFDYAVSERELPLGDCGRLRAAGGAGGGGAGGGSGGAGTEAPRVLLSYGLSPIGVVIEESARAPVELLASACAIIGGGFTIAMLLDSCVLSTAELIAEGRARCRRPRGAAAMRAKLHAR